jgi:hypothetical protein
VDRSFLSQQFWEDGRIFGERNEPKEGSGVAFFAEDAGEGVFDFVSNGVEFVVCHVSGIENFDGVFESVCITSVEEGLEVVGGKEVNVREDGVLNDDI